MKNIIKINRDLTKFKNDLPVVNFVNNKMRKEDIDYMNAKYDEQTREISNKDENCKINFILLQI